MYPKIDFLSNSVTPNISYENSPSGVGYPDQSKKTGFFTSLQPLAVMKSFILKISIFIR
jgi:hypothetical protein